MNRFSGFHVCHKRREINGGPFVGGKPFTNDVSSIKNYLFFLLTAFGRMTAPTLILAVGMTWVCPPAGYDGVRLPFPDASQDAVHSCHCLEHIPDYRATLAEWFRVLKV